MPLSLPTKNNKDTPANSHRDAALFLNNAQNNSAETKSNLIQIPSISLPKGGGALKSIDDKFQVNAVNGTSSYNIPVPLSPCLSSFMPSLSLSYNSGSGNSVYGIGWSLEVPSIRRKTEKELPQYHDDENSDTFIFSGVEDLVPIPSLPSDPANVIRYCPRIEGGFAKIEKVNDNGNVYWRITAKDNIVSIFGQSNAAKLISPGTGQESKIFKWCLEYSYDDKGNFISYYYKAENTDNIPPSLYEKNRQNNIAHYTNIYFKGAKYGNTTPYYGGDKFPVDFMFEIIMDYGEHNQAKPTTTEENKWVARMDPYSDYKAGFEIRTYRICQRMLMFHHFIRELGITDYLVRSLDMVYDEQPSITYLDKISETGYIWNTDGSLQSSKSLPPIQYSYFKPGYSNEVQTISTENIANAPVGLSSPYQWTDLYGEGISGILTDQAGGWFYKENLGNGQFSPAGNINLRPSFSGLAGGTLTIQDLEADGIKYAVYHSPAMKGYFEQTPEGGWDSFQPFTEFPNIDLKDPNLKFLDLNGDGLPDMLISLEQDFIWYEAEGKCGYDNYHLNAKVADDELGPRIVFADQDENLMIALADMSGDGLSDIVLITYASVSYYPNLGFGQFGAKVNMSLNGIFDSPDCFNQRYIYLTDIAGTGTTDIVYTGKADVQVWFNQSGNSFSDPSGFFNPLARIDNETQLAFVDLLGTGTICMTWSSPLPANANAPLRYIDIMGGQKPHIMSGYINNMGKEVAFEYQSSTQYYLNDKLNGINWATKLPFPVQCVSKVVIRDLVSQTRFTNQYSYRHGYYDAIEREFRGFATVTQTDTEEFDNYVKATNASGAVNSVEQDIYQPALITKSWFHTGANIRMLPMLNQLSAEYYPNTLIANGVITDAELIKTLQTYVLAETALPDNLAAAEINECFRALKGLPLRQEIYSNEGDIAVQVHPYSVTEHNYNIQLLHPKGSGKYAVFFTHEKETFGINYERNPADPRISHTINTNIDQYGNIIEAASIVYGRVTPDENLPTDDDRAKQNQQWITYAQNTFTATFDNGTADPLVYRLPVLCEAQTYELTIAPPAQTFFIAEEISAAFSTAQEVVYEQPTTINEKRKISHARTYFLKNDLTGPMPFGTLDTLALTYKNFVLAFTPTLITNLYGTKADDNLLRNQANYVQVESDTNYWVSSGGIYYHPDLSATPNATSIPAPTAADVAFAKANFYLPVAYCDNFDNLTKVFYDPYKLFIQKTIDAVGNENIVTAFNYRTLKPYLLQDINNNLSGARYDDLGMLISTFAMGKAGEFKGDPMDTTSAECSPLDHPTSTFTYDFRYFVSGGQLPNRVIATVNEQHYYAEPQPDGFSEALTWLTSLTDDTAAAQIQSNIIQQTSYFYSDGSGNEVMKKIPAEPGAAPQRDTSGKLILDTNYNPVLSADTDTAPRWIGNGRTIYNNKGNPVKQYEPFFDSSFEYNQEDELTLLGYTPVLYYDATGRLIKTVNPNGTFSTIGFDAWMQKTYDVNDNVLASSWYLARINGGLGADEQQAALQTALHDSTPVVVYFDSLARAFLSIAHNKTQRSNEATVTEEFYQRRTVFDIQGLALSVTDNRANTVMSWRYNMLGHICYQNSMDAGERWLLGDVMGKPTNLWDSRNQLFGYVYDHLHRPLQLTVNINGAGATVFEQYAYGENVTDDMRYNLRGKLYKHYDTAGLTTLNGYDFKGNSLISSRNLLIDYHDMPDWNKNPAINLTETFINASSFDALNRTVQTIAPDNSIFLPQYNEANMLNSLNVLLQGSIQVYFITNINYDAKGQRQQIYYGNKTQGAITTVTKYFYDPVTYRLTRLLTTSQKGINILQDLNYTYDPVGNITRKFDNAQKTVFYGGAPVAAQNNYIYDALYRLVEGGGREHIGQVNFSTNDNWDDSWCNLSLQPNSPVQMRNYTQRYFYDGVGNIGQMQHLTNDAASNWTRIYGYNTFNNQLIKTSVGIQNYVYTYNPHGSMLTMPQLGQIDWNFREEMHRADLIGGGEAYYVYDGSGQRTRKIIERLDGTTAERIYLGHCEIYREYPTGSTDNKDITLERESLHIMDDQHRIAMADTLTIGKGDSPTQLLRYQYSDHLGSACLELDDQAAVISYEEYHPYGTSSYRATDAGRQAPAKRYRYTGIERDDETGLNYHSARYYVPWLGRWMAGDPIGIGDNINLYYYVQGNPIKLIDPSGKLSWFLEQMDHVVNPGPNTLAKGLMDNLAKRGKDLVETDYGAGVKAAISHPVDTAASIAGGVAHLTEDTAMAAVDIVQTARNMDAPGAKERFASRSVDLVLGIADIGSMVDGVGAARNAAVGTSKALVQGAKTAEATAKAAADALRTGRLVPAATTVRVGADALAATAPAIDIATPLGQAAKATVLMAVADSGASTAGKPAANSASTRAGTASTGSRATEIHEASGGPKNFRDLNPTAVLETEDGTSLVARGPTKNLTPAQRLELQVGEDAVRMRPDTSVPKIERIHPDIRVLVRSAFEGRLPTVLEVAGQPFCDICRETIEAFDGIIETPNRAVFKSP